MSELAPEHADWPEEDVQLLGNAARFPYEETP